MKRKMMGIVAGWLLVYAGAIEAQTVSGRVVDEAGKPLDAVSVVLQRADSTFVGAVVTDTTGVFCFDPAVFPYRLVLQHLAYAPKEWTGSSEQTGDIPLTANDRALQEVVVAAERPLVQVENGKLGYDLSVLAEQRIVNNAFEALAELPGITEKDGTLSLAGASSLTIVLNGKPTTMTASQLETLLRNTPVDRVEKAEVMYSAPPEYHVRGAAINVVLKKATDHSFSGEVSADYRNQYFNDGNANANFRYTTPKLAVDVMYGTANDKKMTKIDLYSRHTLQGQVHDIRNEEEIREKGWVHHLRGAFEYHLDDKNRVDVSYFGSYTPSYKGNSYTTGNFQESLLNKETDKRLHNVSLRYTSGFGLELGGDYTAYRMDNSQQMQVDYNDGSRKSFNLSGGQQIDKYTVYADQSHALPENWTFGYGLSYDFARSRDYQVYQDVQGAVDAQDTHSDLKEHTTDLYVSLGKQFGNGTHFSVSATGEYYELGNYRRWAFYPQASFLWMIRPEHMLQVSLSSDKTYPDYWSMQSAVSYLDGYSEIHGTPGLRPANQYGLSGTYIWKQKYLLTAFFEHTNDYFTQSPYQSSDRLALIYKMQNWDYMRQYGVVANIPFSAGSWYRAKYNALGMRMHQRCDDYFDIPFNRKKWVFVTWLDNTFKVGKHVSFELNGRYQSAAIQGTFDIQPLFNLEAAAKWTFAHEKASISIRGNDLLNTGYPKTEVRFRGQYLDMDNSFYNRSVTIHFVYRFGGYKEKKQKEVDTSRFRL